MKKMMTVAAVVVTLVAVTACNNGMGGTDGTKSGGKNERLDRSRRTILDTAKYVDFTLKENNAAKFTKQDIMFELNGSFKIAGGNSYITIDRTDGTITISSDDAWYKGTAGHNMFAKYSFEVQAANGDCLYIRMDKNKKGQMIMDHETMVNHQMPDLAVCIPLYGFSRNRIEVSSIMNGYIAMPSGTYWAYKK